MEAGRGRTLRRAVIPTIVLALGVAGCAAPSGHEPSSDVEVVVTPTTTAPGVPADPTDPFELPDITSRRITRTDLEAMLPQGDATPLPRTNEELVTLAVLDREDEAADILLHGRVTGVGASYADGARVWIDVLADPDAAHDYLGDVARDIAKGIGGTHAPSAGADSTSEFAVEVGQESMGIVAVLSDGSTETLILTRAGRLVIFTSYVHGADDDARVRAQYLAESTIQTIVEVLTESEISPIVDTPRYRFETTTTIEDEVGTTTLTVSGTVDGDDRSCTIRREGPVGADEWEIVEIAGLIWWRSGSGDFARVSHGNMQVAALLTSCPAWPLDADAAGLGAVIESLPDPARHHVNGVDASGYQSDADGLARILGVDSIDASVDALSFWIADEAPWVVELSLSVSLGAADLDLLVGPLLAPTGEATLTVRHRVFDVGTADESIVPPS